MTFLSFFIWLIVQVLVLWIIYVLVKSAIENTVPDLIRPQLDHLDRKHSDRFQILDRSLQEAKEQLRVQGERLKALESELAERRSESGVE
ncbi:hypothetical protein QWJ34_15300 [Saccharibacillus sp. CPCC 101409]|uniref:hypothetical protein n=1 Tax=Saccharibacillus sp. CPCC 101409 TaxID=3058041 RepID=UPI00267229CA|nr:hypothetical protein [Saccharibacillus sp. CPCC 101409]MDO3411131.1 hypothetical protein [Saccharibacillus sp. CPCC 101409]